MSSKQSRAHRQEKRAVKFGRHLVSKEDCDIIIGMSLEAAINYANEKGHLIVIRSVDNKTGPHIMHIDIVDGKVVAVNTTRRFIENAIC